MPFELRVPPVGESIAEVQIGVWRKQEGDWIEKDEVLLELETDKAAMEVPAPVSGTVSKLLKKVGEPATVGEVVAYLEESSKKSAERRNPLASAPSTPAPTTSAPPQPPPANDAPKVMPAAQRELAQRGIAAQDVPPSGPGGRVLKEDVIKFADAKDSKPTSAPTSAPAPAAKAEPGAEEVVPMTLIRKRIAARLVEAQQQAALLTTFNEVDMSSVMALRKEHQDAFKEKYGIKLGFMSFFVKAAVEALKATPQVNAEIRGTNIVYRNYYDIGVAVGGGKGLVVPIIRKAERLSFAEIEKKIAEYGKRAVENKIAVEELEGGTFTISNGGVYGSLLSTPIVNPPQSGILGLHAIQDRPVAREGAVVIRPMMYLALTYDHRIVDGKEAVTFLKRIKDLIENPARILLEV